MRKLLSDENESQRHKPPDTILVRQGKLGFATLDLLSEESLVVAVYVVFGLSTST